MSKELVGFGPSLVDINATLEPSVYEKCRDILSIEPGGWQNISNYDTLKQLLETIVDDDIPHLDVESMQRYKHIALRAGSTILGMFGAMHPAQRQHSHLMTVLAIHDGVDDSFSSFFVSVVRQAGIRHYKQLEEGHNPLGVVLNVKDDGEKTLAMYPGVASELEDCDEFLTILKPDCVFIDTYELQEGKLSTYLDNLIRSNSYRVALSLGNHKVIYGELLCSLRHYIEQGYIDILCGNEQEFSALYPDLDLGMTTQEGFEQHPVRDNVPYILLTRGAMGLSTHWKKRYINMRAHPLQNNHIVTTSGAGDTTMGVYCSGIIEDKDPIETLKKATYLATTVLQVASSMIIANE